jgi:hypothetical protein
MSDGMLKALKEWYEMDKKEFEWYRQLSRYYPDCERFRVEASKYARKMAEREDQIQRILRRMEQ